MESSVTATTPEIDANKTRSPAFVKLVSIRTWLRANKFAFQKSIGGRLGSRSFKNHLSNCGIVASGLTADAHAVGRPHDDRDVQSKELQNAELQFGPLSD
jgi:hypothetical protein